MSPTVVHPRSLRDAGRLLRVVVVLERPAALRPHHARPPRRELAPILVEDVRRADEGAPDRSAMREPVVGVDRGEQVDLRRRVVLVHDRSEPLDHLRLDLRRTWRRRVDDRAQRRQVEATPLILRQPQQADEHRGDHLHVRHPVALDQLQARAGLEAVHDHRGPAQAVHGHREAQRCRVIQRRGREVDRVLVEAVQAPEEPHDRRRRADRIERQADRDRLGASGRAGRVEEVRALALVIERRRRHGGDEVVIGIEAGHARIDRDPRGHLGRASRRGARDVGRGRAGEEDPRRGIAKDVGHFVGGQAIRDAGVAQARTAAPPRRSPDSGDGSPSGSPRRSRGGRRDRASGARSGASAQPDRDRRRPPPSVP